MTDLTRVAEPDDGGAAAGVTEAPVTKRSLWSRLLVGETRLERLRTAIAQMRESLATRAARLVDDKRPFVIDALYLLDGARRALAQRDVNQGWALVLDAERVAVAADTDDELQAKAEALREEIREKLGGWRQIAGMRLLGNPGVRAPLAAVQTALAIRNEDSHNRYHRFQLLAGQIGRLGALLFAALCALLVVAALGMPPLGKYRALLGWASLLGGTGGLLGAMRTLTQGARQKIPEQVAGWPVTLVRPLLGAAAGVGAWLLVQSGVVAIGAKDVELAPLAAAFVAGFSERYFLSIIPGGGK